jgi:hypothetical protein
MVGMVTAILAISHRYPLHILALLLVHFPIHGHTPHCGD